MMPLTICYSECFPPLFDCSDCQCCCWPYATVNVFPLFLVACTRLYNSLCPSVGWLVGQSHFTFFYDFISLTSLLLPSWSGDLKYGPCPPARDFGNRVSGIVFQIMYQRNG